MKIFSFRKSFAVAFASAMMLFVFCSSSFAQNGEDSLRYQAGPKFASSNPDSLVVDDFLWCNRYVMPNQTYARFSDFERLPIAAPLKNHLKAKYKMFITQPIDHKHPEKGLFKQRVIVGFANFKAPTVIITEGYTAKYGANPRYDEEVAYLLQCNFVLVEHRYFNESVPFMQDDSTITWEKLNWDYMTAEQEAADLHEVRKALSHIFYGKWVATGISKGGQNCMCYTMFYPKDVDVSVPYVGPVARAQEDGRHEPFLRDSTGTAEDRAIIFNFQNEILKRRNVMEQKLAEWSEKSKISYNISIPEVLDYCVLEFPFAFWQWGRKTSTIPAVTESDDVLFKYFVDAVGPDYFQSWDDNAPFFVQAAKELGYYGYDTKPYKKLLKIKSSKGYLRKIFLPGGKKFKFDKTLYKNLTNFVATTDNKMMFIYGEWDPWSSVRPLNPGHDNIKFFIAPGGSHRARISNLPPEMRDEAIKTLKEWLDIK